MCEFVKLRFREEMKVEQSGGKGGMWGASCDGEERGKGVGEMIESRVNGCRFFRHTGEVFLFHSKRPRRMDCTLSPQFRVRKVDADKILAIVGSLR